MKAVVTHGFLESIPKKIRIKFRLRAGMVLDFDENASYLKAMPAVASAEPADGFDSWLTSSIGIANDQLTTDGLLHETRGEV